MGTLPGFFSNCISSWKVLHHVLTNEKEPMRVLLQTDTIKANARRSLSSVTGTLLQKFTQAWRLSLWDRTFTYETESKNSWPWLSGWTSYKAKRSTVPSRGSNGSSLSAIHNINISTFTETLIYMRFKNRNEKNKIEQNKFALHSRSRGTSMFVSH